MEATSGETTPQPRNHDAKGHLSSSLIDQLQDFELYASTFGWDGAEAPPVPSNLIELARYALQELDFDQEPHVSPSLNGEVSFVWSSWNNNQLPQLGEDSLWVSLDTDEAMYNIGSQPTETIEWKTPSDLQECVSQLVGAIQPILDRAIIE